MLPWVRLRLFGSPLLALAIRHAVLPLFDPHAVMRFTWNPRTSSRVLLACGFDFEFATGVFAGRTAEITHPLDECAVPHRIATGMTEGIALTVLYADQPDPDGVTRRHLLAARQALANERAAYHTTRPVA